MSKCIKEIKAFLEKYVVSQSRQYTWDNSGLQIGLYPQNKIRKAAFALDPSERVIDKTIKEGCELLITHHPLFFDKIKSISYSNAHGRKIIKAIQANLNIISYHTSADLADFSLNDYLAEKLGAEVKGGLVTEGKETYFKYIVYVPKGHEKSIRDAMHKAGAGVIGNYCKTTFNIEGTGTFQPMNGANPFIGKEGELEKVDEYRIETIVPAANLSRLIDEIAVVHPYEEVAYDIFKLENGKDYSIGRVCSFGREIKLGEFMEIVKNKLGCDCVRYNGFDTNMTFTEFGIVTGSGTSYWKSLQGIKVLLTGDMKHHEALDAYEAGVCVVDAGHFETEKCFMEYLAEKVNKEFNIETIIIEEESPIKYMR
jgi:dinuclear metal center YbgI/SA1388 family protein